MPSIKNVQLLQGYIVFRISSAVNDFESMTVGPCTTLSGDVSAGDAQFGTAFFSVR